MSEVRSLCGRISFKRGEQYVKEGRVAELNSDGVGHFEAKVREEQHYHVKVDVNRSGTLKAKCDCPANASYYGYCKHIAAVLIAIHQVHGGQGARKGIVIPLSPLWGDVPIQTSLTDEKINSPAQGQGRSFTSYRGDDLVSSSLISLFQLQRQSGVTNDPVNEALIGSFKPQKELLQVEFTIKCVNNYRQMRESKFVLEMKVGGKRLYVVNDIGEFLSRIDAGEPHSFTKLFTYDPSLHAFSPGDHELIKKLIDIHNSEFAYRETGLVTSGLGHHESRSKGNKRQLTLPPLVWREIIPLLIQPDRNVLIEQDNGATHSFVVEDGAALPVTFAISKEEETEIYRMDVEGLHDCIIMPYYGCVVVDSRVIMLGESEVRTVGELWKLLHNKGDKPLHISSLQMDSFIEHVVPGLRRLGKVNLDQQIAGRIVEAGLRAKLFLDQDGGVLRGTLEFHYDEIKIQPLSSRNVNQDFIMESPSSSPGDIIVIRDRQRESMILEMIEHSAFRISEDELIAEDEDELYEVLFNLLPKLEHIAEVYVTPAIKRMVHSGNHPPKIKVDTDNSMNWLEVSFEMDAMSEEELQEILRSVIEKKKYYRLPEGAFLSLEDAEFQVFERLYRDLGMKKSDIKGGMISLPLSRGPQLQDRNEESLKGIQWGRSLRRLLDHLKDPSAMDFEVPTTLSSVLREYQVSGFRWMKMLAHYGFGGILADDMGLGKTLQSIAYIVSEHERDGIIAGERHPVLIVAPASLVYNWESEFHRFAPQLRVKVAAGDKQERSDILNEVDQVDVIVTTYPSLRRDIESYQEITFNSLILDEAQYIKNHASQTAQVVKQISAAHRFALTGTPIENSLEELWSIFDAVFPDLFGGRKAFMDLPRDKVAQKARPFILRRLKKDVLRELPDKIETVLQSELHLEQKQLYSAYLTKLQEETAKELEEGSFQKSRIKILAGITRLRQLCCHPALFIDPFSGSSGKLEQLLDVVDEALESGKRMLIFSQFTGMLKLIREELAQRKVELFYLDGATPSRERIELCSRFNQGENQVFLISLKAGGTGLNLTGADTVILYDLWWNPAVEEQATGRAHRLGQKQVVQVIRLVSKGTIEEKILELQERKRDLIQEVISSEPEHARGAATSLTEEEIRGLLMI
ncbi:DEAD/DEAH box helicase [Paenibacillus segetis]|uniref:DEAD/DEAH box helicase n=1 Tax=Paenibacillus segetis TaxID=1325360 RepID=UPI0018896342|nr:DEAD/DEAH box helicase [Paenibacillus segetis]